MSKDFNYLCLVSVEEWYQLQIYCFMKNLARKALQWILTIFFKKEVRRDHIHCFLARLI